MRNTVRSCSGSTLLLTCLSHIAVSMMEDFEALSVSDLNAYLGSQEISKKTLENFSTNMVSGLALTLLDDSHIKELVPIIGDRAIMRNILKKLKQVFFPF